MTGSKVFDNVLLGFLLLATAGTLGVFVYSQMLYEKPLPSDEVELANLKSESKQVVMPDAYQLDKLIINIRTRTTRLRFLDVQAYLVPFKTKQNKFFEDNKSSIQDKFIDIASRMEPNELNSVSGKILLESRLKKAINELHGKPVVKKIYFTRFVVQ